MTHPPTSTAEEEIELLLAKAKALPWYYGNMRLLYLERAQKLIIHKLENDLLQAFNSPMVAKLFSHP